MLEGIVTWAEIDLDAIAHNVQSFQQYIGSKTEIIAVVKANAYGHGAAPVAQAALQAGATRLAVHRLVEGVELRQAGIEAPILIMGTTPPDGATIAVQWRLTPSLISLASAQALSAQAQSHGVEIPVHLKVDTGMSRYGLLPDEIVKFAGQVGKLPGLVIEGLFSHFATADWEDQSFTNRQLDVFIQVIETLQRAGIEIPFLHIANSAAGVILADARFSAVRLGISMYGLAPSSEWDLPYPIHPALALKSRLSRVRTLPAGSAVSYGRTYIAPSAERFALVPIGYGDGYHRSLSNKASVLIHGQRALMRGRVCMDQIVVDVTAIEGVGEYDEVVLIGAQGDEQITAAELAELAGTIHYEITTALLPRVARLYLRDGKAVHATVLGFDI